MKIGAALPWIGPALGEAAAIGAFAAHLEELGVDSLWGGERLLTPVAPSSPYPGGADDYAAHLDTISRHGDPLLVAAAAATATRRVRFNFSTLAAPLHHPVPLARALTTLDVLTSGRLDAGFGLGWMRDEYETVGVPWDERGRRLDDLLTFLDTWWTQDVVAYDGPFFSVPRSRVGLRPVQRGGPPVHLGGLTERALRRVGRRAAGWLGLEAPAPFVAALWDVARRAAEDAGRDPDALRKVIRVNAVPGESTASVSERVARVGEQGADEVVVDFVFAGMSLDRQRDAFDAVLHACATDRHRPEERSP